MSAWIVKHEDGRKRKYQARFSPRGGRVVTRSFAVKERAEAWLKTQEVDNLRGDWVDPRRGQITVESVAREWIKGKRASPATLARDRALVYRHIIGVRPKEPRDPDALGLLELRELTPQRIREWIASREKKELSPATIQKAYQLLGAMIAQAVEDRRLNRSPMPARPNLPQVVQREMRVLTPGEVHRLADATPDRYRAMVLLATYSGMRFGECAGLQVSDVDLLRHRVSVVASLSEVNGVVSLRKPKTANSRRTVAIPRQLADELAHHIGEYSADGFVFTTETGAPVRASNFRPRVWKLATDRADLDGVRFHDLRHTHASQLIAMGEHAKVISERLGHRSIKVTFDVYGHLMPGLDDEVADRLGQHWVERDPVDPPSSVRRLQRYQGI